MKGFMQPRSPILRDYHAATDNQATSPNPSLQKQRSSRKQKPSSKENAPPADHHHNALPDSSSSPSMAAAKPPLPSKAKSPLPPRPPASAHSNPLKRKLIMDTIPESTVLGSSDSGVKVIVRVRPPNKDEEEGEMIVEKISGDTLSLLGQNFTFDSVADSGSSQENIYQLVGKPLVENCLAGFNSSIFAYGQTGSGKTYTMWGPANALLEENQSSNQQGLTPRVFEQLFARMNEEEVKYADRQLKYLCRCSFLEIYNEQITDLLDPNQRNLQIREDVKSGVYVESLTEESVSSMKDVTQLLIKGLSNRRTGATSINAESSRSHSVFTCVVESQCKSTTDGLSSFRSSRINLVDLAGSERQKLTGAQGERLKEAGNINRSLSQLGNLINILAEVSQTGKQRHIPYRDSRLTFLLQESLGGNAKLAMICAISPAQSCKSETFSTLRFAQRAKAIKNKAIVNEVTQDDVNVLREVIRQLKDELLRVKANGNPTDSNGSYATSWNARRSLSLLKMSLNCPMALPRVEDDSDEEMEIVEEDEKSKNPEQETSNLNSETVLREKNHIDQSGTTCGTSEEADVSMEDCQIGVVSEEVGNAGLAFNTSIQPALNFPESSESVQLHQENIVEEPLVHSNADLIPVGSDGERVQGLERNLERTSEVADRGLAEACPSHSSPTTMSSVLPSNLSIVSCEVSPVLHSPPLSISPRASNSSRKSLRTSSMVTASQKDLAADMKLSTEAPQLSFGKSLKTGFSNALVSQPKQSATQTEHLAASLHRGLQIIDSHRQSSAFRRSSFRFSYKPTDVKPIMPVEKVDVGVQTLPEYPEMDNNEANLQLVPVEGSPSGEKLKNQVPKAVEKVLAGAIRREMALEEFCAKQTAEITQLNRLVQQYKHERECNAIIERTREDKISRLESLMDGVLPTEEFMEDELISLTNEYKLLKEKYENHPEILRTKIELRRVQDELDSCRNFFDMGERDVLLEEIQHLRSQLQYYVDSSPAISARKASPPLQLTYPSEPTEKNVDKFEAERCHWTEAESKWISLSEELRTELEASRTLAEKQRVELDSERKCSEELKEAMQMAMQGHARILEQYADLQEKHLAMHARNRQMQEGVQDIKKAAAKAGVKGAESKFINALAAELSALKVEREKERRYFLDERKGLQAQLRDTAEAVQAAGELLVRLKEAEEVALIAQTRAAEAEKEVEKAYRQIDKLQNQAVVLESRSAKEVLRPAHSQTEMTKYEDGEDCHSTNDELWKQEFNSIYNEDDSEFSKLAEPPSSWFAGYDRCNI